MHRIISAVLVAGVLTGCAIDEDDPDLAETESALSPAGWRWVDYEEYTVMPTYDTAGGPWHLYYGAFSHEPSALITPAHHDYVPSSRGTIHIITYPSGFMAYTAEWLSDTWVSAGMRINLSVPGNLGLVLRASDAGNMYRAYVKEGGVAGDTVLTAGIERRVGGAVQPLVTRTFNLTNWPGPFEFEAVGPILTLRKGGNVLLQVADGTFTEGYAGVLGTSGASATISQSRWNYLSIMAPPIVTP